jgi:hypothetical protein
VNCWGGVDDVNCYWLVFLGLKSMFLVFGAEAGEVHLLIFVCNCIESEGNALDSSLSGNHTTPFL